MRHWFSHYCDTCGIRIKTLYKRAIRGADSSVVIEECKDCYTKHYNKWK